MTHAIIYSAPAAETPSPDYTMEVDGRPVFVYAARVRAEILQKPGLWSHVTDPPGERASFAIFDATGPVDVVVRPARPFAAAEVLPARAGIAATVAGGCVRLRMDRPQMLTIVLDGSDMQPLHIFAAAPPADLPDPTDPSVIYFGPGMHEITTLELRSGQTLFIDAGAVVKATVAPGETGVYSDKWQVTFFQGAVVNVKDSHGVRICGRGILDASLIPHPGRNMICLDNASDVRIEGVTLRDAANWNFVMRRSHDLLVKDIRIISGRLNSDGINSVSSQRVAIRGCFVRNHDDSMAVKTTVVGVPAEDIAVDGCTIWNDWGYALGPTYETRAEIRRVSYRRCDILFARHWCLGVHLSDSATVSDITFADIHIDNLLRPPTPGTAYAALAGEPKLLHMAIVQDCWGNDGKAGLIRDVTVDGVVVHGERMPISDMYGFDADHDIRGVTFRNIRLGGKAVTDAAGLGLQKNEHVKDVRVE